MILHVRRVAFAALTTLALSLTGAIADESEKPSQNDAEAPAIEPPTVSRETTYFLGPLDEDGFVDYVEALNRSAPDYGIANEDNAYVGILQQLDTSDWDADYRSKLYAVLELPLPDLSPATTFDFDAYVKHHGLDEEAEQAEDKHTVEGPYLRQPFTLNEAQAQFELSLEGPWQTADAPQVATWLDKLNGQLTGVINAVRREGYYCPLVKTHPGYSPIDILLPHLGKSRSIARALQARAFHSLGQDKISRAIEDIISMERLSRLITHEQFLISHLVAISIESLANQASRELLVQKDLTAKHVARLRASRRLGPRRLNVEFKISLERAFALDGVTDILRDANTQAMGRIHKKVLAETEIDPHEMFDLERALRRVNDVYDRLADPPRQNSRVDAWSRSIETMLSKRRGDPEEILARVRELQENEARAVQTEIRELVTDAITNLMLSLITPAFESAIKSDRQSLAFSQLVDLGLALRAYQFAQGRYPETLDALVPEYVEAIPLDFATGAPLKYERRGDGVVVYSVGPDGEDDGGRHDLREGDIAVMLP